MDINNLTYLYQSFSQLLIENPLDHPIALVTGLIGYAQQDTSLTDFQTTNYRVIELTELFFAYTLHYITHGQSETVRKLYCLNLRKQQECESKTQQTTFHITYELSMLTETDKNFPIMFFFKIQN